MISHEAELDRNFGEIGTPRRDRFEIRHLFWCVARDIVKKRRDQSLSQEGLAKLARLDIKDIKSIERGAVTTAIPKIHKIWIALGVPTVPVSRSQEKSSRKRSITKQSPSLRTIVR